MTFLGKHKDILERQITFSLTPSQATALLSFFSVLALVLQGHRLLERCREFFPELLGMQQGLSLTPVCTS